MNKLKELVVKANELIEMPVDFNLMQLKLFARIIVSIRADPNKEFYSFSVKALLEDFGLSDTNYTQLKLATKGLIKPVTVRGEGIEEEQLPFFDKISYTAKGLVKFRMTGELKPLILDLEKNYTKYYFSNIAMLKSAYAIRIYELLKQYEYKGERILSLDEIREFLKIDADKYKQYGHFKSKVISVAQKELKSKTDIYFDMEEIKKGKKVFAIKFVIYSNEKNKKIIESGMLVVQNEDQEGEDGAETEPEKSEILKLLVDTYKISKKIAVGLVETVSVEQIQRNIQYAEKEYKNGTITKNMTGYVVGAIKNDYANTVSIFDLGSDKKGSSARKEKQLAEKREDLKSKLSLEFSRSEKEKFLNSLSETEKEELKKQILEEIQLDSYSVALFKKKGLTSPVAGVGILRRLPKFEERREKYIDEKLREAGF